MRRARAPFGSLSVMEQSEFWHCRLSLKTGHITPRGLGQWQRNTVQVWKENLETAYVKLGCIANGLVRLGLAQVFNTGVSPHKPLLPAGNLR